MKKGFRGTGTVERVDFPNKGIAVTDDGDRVIELCALAEEKGFRRAIRWRGNN